MLAWGGLIGFFRGDYYLRFYLNVLVCDDMWVASVSKISWMLRGIEDPHVIIDIHTVSTGQLDMCNTIALNLYLRYLYI